MKFKLLNKPWFYLAAIPLAVLGVHVFELGVFVYELGTREDRLDAIFVVGRCLEELPKDKYYDLREAPPSFYDHVEKKFGDRMASMVTYQEFNMVYYISVEETSGPCRMIQAIYKER